LPINLQSSLKLYHWPFNTAWWWKTLRGVTATNWSQDCRRCRMSGQAHTHHWTGACWRFVEPVHRKAL